MICMFDYKFSSMPNTFTFFSLSIILRLDTVIFVFNKV